MYIPTSQFLGRKCGCGVACLGDDAPRARAKGAEGAEGDRLVREVEVLGLDERAVVLGLAGAVGVGSETTFHRRLVPVSIITQAAARIGAMRARLGRFVRVRAMRVCGCTRYRPRLS